MLRSLDNKNVRFCRFGGIVPIIVQDFHQRNIDTVVKNTLKNAAMTVENIDAIAVTIQPG